jgi:4-hydroxy-3-methylbut-2-enyl diphosphate reductase
MSAEKKTIYLALPRGFCAGVRRSVEMVEKALKKYGAPIFVRHQIVHNKYVVENFEKQGVHFIENLSDAPVERPLIFSAHGVSPDVEHEARKLGFNVVIDSTCPLVKKLHREAMKFSQAKWVIILIGKKGHPEVEGILGHITGKNAFVVGRVDDVSDLPDYIANAKIVCLSQTTLSSEKVEQVLVAIKNRFQNAVIQEVSGICYASRNRQKALKSIVPLCKKIIVLASPSSSNAQELCTVASQCFSGEVMMLETPEELNLDWVKNISTLGVTSAASTPEILVERLLALLKTNGWNNIIEVGEKEPEIHFSSDLI